MSRATVFKNMKKIREGKGPKRKRHQRGLKRDSNVRRSLTQLALCHPKWLAKDLVRKAKERWGITVVDKTIRSTLFRSGIKKWKPAKEPLLTEARKQRRLSWCHEHVNIDWKRVVFTDESYFQTFRNCIKLWAKTKPAVQQPKWSPKVTIWGGICWERVTALTICNGHVNSESYQDILEECLVPSADVYYPSGYILQQENATPHTSKSTKTFFEKNNIKVLSWPANSPDLNPIENLRSIMKHKIKIDPTKVDDLITAINHVWNGITQVVRVTGRIDERSNWSVYYTKGQ